MSDLSLLPSDPEGFFELNEGYDRRNLKRAYGKAIRQYKPETHPAEFQLVREAYEQLEQALRYGQKQKRHQQAAQAWEKSFKPAEETQSSSVESAAGSETVNEASASPPTRSRSSESLSLRELAIVDPKSAFERYQSQTRKTPQDYYTAAVLADAIKGRSTHTYVSILLDGLVAYPTDPGLRQLIAEFFRSEVPDSLIEKMLRGAATKIRQPIFYALTEPLWLRLLDQKQIDFGRFQSVLEACEREISQTDLAMRDAFYLRIVRLAVWVAPPAWTDRVLRDLESRSASMDGESQSDLEFATEIQTLLRIQGARPGQYPIRSKLLRSLRLACSESSHQSLRQILALLNEAARDTAGFQKDFPVHQSEVDEPWLGVVYRLISQLQPFIVETEDGVSPERQIEQTQELLSDLTVNANEVIAATHAPETWYKTVPVLVWVIGGSVFGTLPMAVVAMMISQGPAMTGILVVGIATLMIGLVVSFYRWLFPTFLRPKMEQQRDRNCHRVYQNMWRSRLFRFARSSSDTLETNLAKIHYTSEQTGHVNLGHAVRYFVTEDTGLQIYSVLQLIRS